MSVSGAAVSFAEDKIKANNANPLNDPSSWENGLPGPADVAVWGFNGVSAPLDAPLSWQGIRIADPVAAVTIGAGTTAGDTLTLGAAGINMSAATQNLTIAEPVVASTAQVFDVATGRALTFSGVLSGTGTTVTKSGSGTLFVAAPTVSTIQIDAGVVNQTLAGGTTTFALNGGTLSLTNGSVGNPINVLGGGGTITVSSNRTVNGPVTGSGALILAPSGNSLLSFGGNNGTFSGSITVTAPVTGTVRITNVNAGSALATFTLNTAVTSNQSGTIAFGSLSGNGNLSGSSNTTTYSIGALNTSTSYGGVIANASITKTGSGALTLTGASTYSGNTTIDGGSLVVSTATATLGTSAVSVLSTAINLTIQTGVTNALGNSSVLSLAGGGTAGAADFGFANLGAGVNETVGGLILGGNQVALGTYGSTDSPAEFKLNEFFSGTGIITVVPEPGAVVMLLSGLGMLGLMRRRSRA